MTKNDPKITIEQQYIEANYFIDESIVYVNNKKVYKFTLYMIGDQLSFVII
jgi:hypothetical protein